MEINRVIEIVDSTGVKRSATVSGHIDWSTHGCHLTLTYEGQEVTGLGLDFFDAFCRIREQLAADGLLPVCYGASRNVWPNGMLRDMALGLIALRLEKDRRLPDVDIFGSGADLDLVSVETQRMFINELFNRRETSV